MFQTVILITLSLFICVVGPSLGLTVQYILLGAFAILSIIFTIVAKHTKSMDETKINELTETIDELQEDVYDLQEAVDDLQNGLEYAYEQLGVSSEFIFMGSSFEDGGDEDDDDIEAEEESTREKRR